MIRAALRLAEKGLAVFPCVPARQEPACRHGFHDATTDPDRIAAWWEDNPSYNIGIATGAVSGFFAFDVDNKNDKDGEAELRKLEAAHEPLPPSVEVITGSGRHVYFRHPGKPVRNSVGDAGGIAPGIDIRGDGGYVVAPPSMHPCGRRYAWSVDSANEFADAPPWLIDAVTATGGSRRISAQAAVALPASHWRGVLSGRIADGARNQTLTKVSGHLLSRFIDPLVTLAIVQSLNATHCAPPLTPDEVETIVESICARELKKRGASGGGHGA